MVTQYHYLKKPVDVRCSPVAYQIMYQNRFSEDAPMGCLIFGRPEATRVNGWYGSVEDVLSGKCRITRWQVLNLARVWLNPDIQRGGWLYIENAATWAIAQVLKQVVYDYLVCKPPVWMSEPYEIREVLSYCDTRIHQGTLYKASNFHLVRTNDYGIETYVRSVRRLTHAEKAQIAVCSQRDKRCQKVRAQRAQLPLFEGVGA
jgi:hypothetical protein